MSKMILAWLQMHGLPPDLVVAALAGMPISEVRGGIPAGYFLLNLPLWRATVVAVLAEIAVLTPLLVGFEWMTKHLQQAPIIGPVVRWSLEHANKKKHFVEKYGMWAMTLWCAAPIPGFGGWSGFLIGPLAGLPFIQCFIAVVIGTAIQGSLVAGLVAGGHMVAR